MNGIDISLFSCRCPALHESSATDDGDLLGMPVRGKWKPGVLFDFIVMTFIAASMCFLVVTAMLK